MEGIKEAIAYITGLAVKAEKPETIEINGRTYCTKDLRRYDAADKAEPIKATTAFKLVAADGGLWKSQAVDNVKNYLVKALADVPDREKITIIA